MIDEKYKQELKKIAEEIFTKEFPQDKKDFNFYYLKEESIETILFAEKNKKLSVEFNIKTQEMCGLQPTEYVQKHGVLL